METADAVRRSQDYRPCLAASRRVESHERVAILHQTDFGTFLLILRGQIFVYQLG